MFSEASGGALVINLYGSDSRQIDLYFLEGDEYSKPENYCPYFLDNEDFQYGKYPGVYAVVQGVKDVPLNTSALRRATFNLETIKGDYEQLRFRINPNLEENYEIDLLLQMTAYVMVEHVKDENNEDVWKISPEINPPSERVENLAGIALIDKKTRTIEPCALFLMPFYLEARLK